jgi:hypothetical protein
MEDLLRTRSLIIVARVVVALVAGTIFAAGPKTYQVTGPVLTHRRAASNGDDLKRGGAR